MIKIINAETDFKYELKTEGIVGDRYHYEKHQRVNPTGDKISSVWLPSLYRDGERLLGTLVYLK